MESDRNMKTWEDLRGSENSNPALSSREELPMSISEMQDASHREYRQKRSS